MVLLFISDTRGMQSKLVGLSYNSWTLTAAGEEPLDSNCILPNGEHYFDHIM